jgi:hypothetical protein
LEKRTLDTTDSIRNIHVDRKALLIGSGPSLDNLDLSKYPEHLIFSIGQSIIALPKADYFCMTDGSTIESTFWSQVLEKSTKIIACGEEWLRSITQNSKNCIFLSRRPFNSNHCFKNEPIIWGIDVSHCTAHIIYIMGIRDITLVGIDYLYKDGQKYASTTSPVTVKWGRNQKNADVRGTHSDGHDDPVFDKGIAEWTSIKKANPDLHLSVSDKLSRLDRIFNACIS